MLPGFRSVPFDDAGALRDAVGENTAAVMIEAIQGESGVYPLSDETLLAARQACDETGALLILDEIQTGMGRTGSLWAYEQTPVRPDLLTSAKALGGGLPVGACVTSEELGEVLEPGDHGSTFAGGAVVSAAALAVLDLVDDPALLRRVRELGAGLRESLLAIDGVDEVRGRGLMLGVGLASGIDAAAVGRRPARARPDRQRARARHAAPAAAADGRFGPDRAGRCADRRIAPKLRGRMSAEKFPPKRRPPASAADAAQRLATIVDAAERAAASVIDDAEQQAQQHLDEARDRADRIVAERLRELADELDPPSSGERRTGHLKPVESPAEATTRSSRLAPRRSGSAGARLLATQMAVSGAEPQGDRSAAAQRLRHRGHQRDPRRDPRPGGLNRDARRPDPDHGPARRPRPPTSRQHAPADRRPDRGDRRPRRRDRRDRLRQREQRSSSSGGHTLSTTAETTTTPSTTETTTGSTTEPTTTETTETTETTTTAPPTTPEEEENGSGGIPAE